MVRDSVLVMNILQVAVTEEKQCSDETFLVLYSVPSVDYVSCSFSFGPPPYPSEGGLILLVESAIVFAVFQFSFLI